MNATYRPDNDRRMGRRLAAAITSIGPIRALRKIGSRIASAAEQALQDMFGSGGQLVPIPVRAKRDRRQRRSYD